MPRDQFNQRRPVAIKNRLSSGCDGGGSVASARSRLEDLRFVVEKAAIAKDLGDANTSATQRPHSFGAIGVDFELWPQPPLASRDHLSRLRAHTEPPKSAAVLAEGPDLPAWPICCALSWPQPEHSPKPSPALTILAATFPSFPSFPCLICGLYPDLQFLVRCGRVQLQNLEHQRTGCCPTAPFSQAAAEA